MLNQLWGLFINYQESLKQQEAHKEQNKLLKLLEKLQQFKHLKHLLSVSLQYPAFIVKHAVFKDAAPTHTVTYTFLILIYELESVLLL